MPRVHTVITVSFRNIRQKKSRQDCSRKCLRAAVRTIPLCVLVAAVWTADRSAHGQESLTTAPPATSFVLEDWGLERSSDIRRGQLSRLKRTNGDTLLVYFLGKRVPRAVTADVRGSAPADSTEPILVAGFARSNRNALGGYFNAFDRSPSEATISIDRAPDGRRGLNLRCDRKAAGYCGMWIHLFDFALPPDERVYLDASAFQYISFWVRGHKDGAVHLKIADSIWERKEDAAPMGALDGFVRRGSQKDEWEQVLISLSDLPKSVDRTHLASLVFEQTAIGEGSLFVRNLAFVRTVEQAPGPGEVDDPDSGNAGYETAVWIWNTAELQADSVLAGTVTDFLSKEGITRAYLQLPDNGEQKSGPGLIYFDWHRMRDLMSTFTRSGIKVYALDGYAGYALPEYHEGVLKTIDNVIAFNLAVDEDERFYGVRYDIEPYLLPGFHGPRRDFILKNFLTLLKAAAERTRAAGLVFGADIPFWYDAVSEQTYEKVQVTFEGRTMPASHHVIDLVDDVAIMDYRTAAYGADGTIRHGAGEVEYGGSVGTPVFVGLETYPLPDEELIEFHGQPGNGMHDVPGQHRLVVMGESGDECLVSLLDLRAVAEPAERRSLLSQALPSIPLADISWWRVRRRIPVLADKLSFAGHTNARLRRTMSDTAREFKHLPGFAGFAIHDITSLMDLVRRSTAESPGE